MYAGHNNEITELRKALKPGEKKLPLMPDFQRSVSVAVTVAVVVFVAKYVRITFIRKNFVRIP